MASAAMPAIANFLMRTSIKRLTEDERVRAGNQLTVWTDGLLYQDVISTRRFDGRIMKSMPPDQGRVCLRLVARFREKPRFVQEWLAAAECSPSSKPAASKTTAAKSAAGPKLRSKRGAVKLRRRK